MKNFLYKLKHFIHVILCVTLVWLFSGDPVYSETINLTTGEFCPYVYKSENGNGYTGFWIDVLTEIFENKGYKLNFRINPWQRAFATYNEQKVDGIIGVFDVLPVRKDIVLYPETEICQYSHAFYAMKDSHLKERWEWDSKGIDALKNIRLGVVAGYIYGNAELDKYIATSDKVEHLKGVKDIVKRNFLKLIKGRIDVYLEDYPMAERFLTEQKAQNNPDFHNIIRLSILKEVINAYVAFYNNGTGKRYAAIFDEGMQQLRTSGKLKTILERYPPLEDWKSEEAVNWKIK